MAKQPQQPQYPRVRNQVDHRADFFRRLAAGEVQNTNVPIERSQPPPPAVKRAAPTDDAGNPMSLAEQLGLLNKLQKQKNAKPKKRIVRPVVLNADKPRPGQAAPLPQLAPPVEAPAEEPQPVVAEEMPVIEEEKPADTGTGMVDLFSDLKQ